MPLTSPRSRRHVRSNLRAIFYFCCGFVIAYIIYVQRWHGQLSSPILILSQNSGSISHQQTVRSPVLDDTQIRLAIRKQHPIHRLQCGSWVEAYSKLHADILTGRAPQRYALMRSLNKWENGLADRLASSVGILLYALLTNRAYQYDYEGADPLWSGLRSDYIDWQYKGWDSGDNRTVTYDYNCARNPEEEFFSMFKNEDLTLVGGDVHTVIWHADHSVVYKAFENPFLKPKLDALGLRQETAFACLFDFLYRPTPEVVNAIQPQLSTLLDPAAVKIGVQIRVGDWQLVSGQRYMFHPQEHPSLFDHYFDCAQQIEEQVAAPGQRVVWYVLTDMGELREIIAAKYGSKVLVSTDVVIEHTVKNKAPTTSGFLQAVAEVWAFSLADWHVITRKSGFGKVGAMVNAKNTKHIFTIDYPMQIFNLWGLGGPAFDNRKVVKLWQYQRSCKPSAADKLSKLCTDFTGC